MVPTYSLRIHLSILRLKVCFSVFCCSPHAVRGGSMFLTSASKMVQSSHLISFTIQNRTANRTATTTMVRPTRTWLAALMPGPWFMLQIAGEAGGDGSMKTRTWKFERFHVPQENFACIVQLQAESQITIQERHIYTYPHLLRSHRKDSQHIYPKPTDIIPVHVVSGGESALHSNSSHWMNMQYVGCEDVALTLVERAAFYSPPKVCMHACSSCNHTWLENITIPWRKLTTPTRQHCLTI